jgi:shikimate dehydrogenase
MTHRVRGRLVLLGHPVAQSLSPTIQNAALRSAGLPPTYEALDVAPTALRDTLTRLRAEQGAGNVTFPHKEAVAENCDWLSDLARRVGAVNTFWTRDGQLFGDNTDVGGFDAGARALLEREPSNLVVTLLGGGGAASAAAEAMAAWPGCRLRIVARTRARAEAIASRLGAAVDVFEDVDLALAGSGLVVNATPVGLRDDALPLAIATLPRDAAVFDLIYRRGETEWVRAARAAGHRATDGLTMLVEQGALAFERWLGIAPDRAAMWEAIGERRDPLGVMSQR